MEHTGLTPTSATMPTMDIDAILAEVDQSTANELPLPPLEYAFQPPSKPNLQGNPNQYPGERRRSSLEALVDPALAALPLSEFIDNYMTYGQTVGPGQNLQSRENFQPARPLNLLIAGCEPPANAVQTYGLDTPMQVHDPSAVYGYGYNANTTFDGMAGADYSQMQMPTQHAQQQLQVGNQYMMPSLPTSQPMFQQMPSSTGNDGMCFPNALPQIDTSSNATYGYNFDSRLSAYPQSALPHTGFTPISAYPNTGFAPISAFPNTGFTPVSALPHTGLTPLTQFQPSFDFSSDSMDETLETDPSRRVSSASGSSGKSILAETFAAQGIKHNAPPAGQTKYFGEAPTRPADKPWVRLNGTTQGKTSRTGKINHYDASQFYSVVPHPLGPTPSWRGALTGTTFQYNRWHELTKDALTTAQVKDFIYTHPKTAECKLTLYIQRSPADSKRRYATSTLDKCRFADCPMRHYGNKGSFLHGHYRVAFDELSHKYGKGELNDPFHVAGYVHLYCLERFLDLAEICRLPNIRVVADGRTISKEPNGMFAPGIGGAEYRVAANFIEAAGTNNLRSSPEWANYPTHEEYVDRDGSKQVVRKTHKYTLNYALQMCKNQGRGGRVMSMMKPSNVAVHRGDLEMYCLGRKGLLSQTQIDAIIQELNDDDAESSMDAGRKRSAESGFKGGNKRARR